MLKIVFLGDVVGKPGREILEKSIPELKNQYNYDLLIVNGENSAGGRGINPQIADDFFSWGADLITLGDHAFDEKKIIPYLSKNERLIQPYNHPTSQGGKGYCIIESKGLKIGVTNLLGRVFMTVLPDCPFKAADQLIENELKDCDLIFIDFQAEATAEKQALLHYLKGKVSLLVGTHTHVQTSDEHIREGTGYITDLGCTASQAGVIGFAAETSIPKFIDLPVRFEPATGEEKVSGVYAEFNTTTKHCTKIERI